MIYSNIVTFKNFIYLTILMNVFNVVLTLGILIYFMIFEKKKKFLLRAYSRKEA